MNKLQWFRHPGHDHIVQFYPDEDLLLRYLEEFIRGGLAGNDSCVVIATAEHIRVVDGLLATKQIDLAAARMSKRYITLDAQATLSSFMVGGMPDWQLFEREIGGLLAQVSTGGNKIRAYGEMVALLWEEGNAPALIELEKFWNVIARQYQFSLYCAYPSYRFDGTDTPTLAGICQQHGIVA